MRAIKVVRKVSCFFEVAPSLLTVLSSTVKSSEGFLITSAHS